MPITNQQRQRSRVTNATSKKKGLNPQREYEATRNNPNALRIPLRECPPLWIAPELNGGESRRDGIWLAPSRKKA
jgi:hypothetical protein